MADITIASTWSTSVQRPVWLATIAHRAEVLRRRARRNRYLAVTGRSSRRYPWFEAMFAGMSGR